MERGVDGETRAEHHKWHREPPAHSYVESVTELGAHPNTQPTDVGPGNDHVGWDNLNVAAAVELLAVLDGLQGRGDDPLVVLGVEHAIALRQSYAYNLLLHREGNGERMRER